MDGWGDKEDALDGIGVEGGCHWGLRIGGCGL